MISEPRVTYYTTPPDIRYAKYSAKEAAERAVSALHGQEVCGARLKVMPADPQDKNSTDTTRKRPKMMEQD